MPNVSEGTARLDVRKAMRCAIYEHYGRRLAPYEPMTLVPSDSVLDGGLGISGWAKWKRTLERVIGILAGWGYTLAAPPTAPQSARDLVDKTVSQSNAAIFADITVFRDTGVAASCNEGN